MNAMVYIGKIIELSKVENSDNLNQATVICGTGGKWTGVVKITDFNLGDECQVYLPDSLLPDKPKFEFMKNKKMIVKQCRLRGAISEVLIMPKTQPGNVGDNITLLEEVTKFEKPIPLSIAGDVAGNFPSFVPKTDEPNFQVVSNMLKALTGKAYVVTEKADGSSGTYIKHENQEYACSRNLSMKDKEGNLIWALVRKYKLNEILPDGYAIQFEMIGPKIQGNPMGVDDSQLKVFNIYDIKARKYWDHEFVEIFTNKHNIPMVKILGKYNSFNLSETELRNMAKGNYDNGKPREGIVIRPMVEEIVDGERLSFKVINLEYKH
jgi:RNA ligase (TIGR02306 family)